MMNLAEVTCVGSIVFAAGSLATYHASSYRELLRSRRETSRFPLFEARSNLVNLVVHGKMSESDPVWKDLYRNVAFLLGLDQRLHMADFLWRYIRVRAEQEQIPSLKAKLNDATARRREAASRVPELGQVIAEVDRALVHLVTRRTRAWHLTAVFLVVVGLRLAYVAFTAGAHTARVVGESLWNPSVDDFKGWQSMNDDDRAAI